VFFCFSANGKVAYLSTKREGGTGAKDIYKLIFLGSEKEMILAALEKNEGVQTKAALSLGISERVLRYKMGKYMIKAIISMQ
jgi:DNA-binding protein Fis